MVVRSPHMTPWITALVISASLAAASPQTATAAVTAEAEVEDRTCCAGYGSSARDVVTVTGSAASDKVTVVSVDGGYEIHDPAGVTPSGACAALSETAARCERGVDPALEPLGEPPALTISGGLGDDELSAAGVASDTPVVLDGGLGADAGATYPRSTATSAPTAARRLRCSTRSPAAPPPPDRSSQTN
jgi:hypothetical protein